MFDWISNSNWNIFFPRWQGWTNTKLPAVTKQYCRFLSVVWAHLCAGSKPLFSHHVFHRWSDGQYFVTPSLPEFWIQQNMSGWTQWFKTNLQCSSIQDLFNNNAKIVIGILGSLGAYVYTQTIQITAYNNCSNAEYRTKRLQEENLRQTVIWTSKY